MIRNILLDWSGTLVDDLPAVWEATNHVFRLAGVRQLTLDEFRAEFSLPFPEYYRRVLPTHVPVERLETWFHEHFRQIQGGIRELPHARDFLEFCRRSGLRLFLLTTVPQEHFEVQSAANGFGQYFEHRYLGIRDKRQKIGEILTNHGLHPDETVFVGDMQHDIDTAHHGGIRSCAVLTGYNSLDQLRASRPNLIVEHLGELRRLLEETSRDPFRPAGSATAAPGNHAPIATVGALIFRPDGRALLVRTRKWSNLWGIPGGKIQHGETAEAALRRELLEETNLPVDHLRFVLVQDCIHSTEFYRPAHFLLLNYTCACEADAAVQLNDEAQEYRWLTLQEALAMPLNQPTRRLIEAVLPKDPEDPSDLKDRGAMPPLRPQTAVDTIVIRDLELYCHVGVPPEERAQPQRLLLTLELECDVTAAAAMDDLTRTIDYFAVSQRLLHLGQDRSWKLIETLAAEIADLLLREFHPAAVTVEIQKFILPETRHVAVRVRRTATSP